MLKKYIYLLFVLLSVSADAQICVGPAGQATWTAWQDLHLYHLGELYADEYYPTRPDVTTTIYKLQSPINFANYMGGRIIGFISVPADDDVVFNITGDDITRFYLSSDSNPGGKELKAFADQWSQVAEHDKFPTQTSDSISLVAGQHYYFELIYTEGGGGDHVSLYWKTKNDDPNNWKLVNSNFIHAVGCLPAACPERNTPCDDGDGNTINDKEDGHCNCVGQPTSSNSCIGPQHEITAYAYDSIPGSSLNDLYNTMDFPGMPDISFELNELALGYSVDRDSTGTLIQSFLTVPVTGSYKFNITGNNGCVFFLSSDDDPANKDAYEISVPGSTNPTEHSKYVEQTSDAITLNAGEYYYFELHHKEGSYSEHFSIFWKTPFLNTSDWKRISDFYVYDYTCEIACIPSGFSCDDGDPFTNNDMYDDNCACVGTPCVGAACNDPIASYTPYDKCSTTDQLDNRADNNWISCSTDTNPNSLRADSHWIQYDLGKEYELGQTHIWNYNVPGETDKGFQNVAIDYSLDGTNWTALDIYSWPLADGSSDYSGFIGPDFLEVKARYVLITSLDSGSACRGFGKIVFNATHCPTQGETCDDGDQFTINDAFDADCNCIGIYLNLNDCDVDSLLLGDTLLYTDVYSAIKHIQSSNPMDNNSNVLYVAGEDIDMNEGFEVPLGTGFTAILEDCVVGAPPPTAARIAPKRPLLPDNRLSVVPVADTDLQLIEFHALMPGKYTLEIMTQDEDNLFIIFNHEVMNRGIYTKRIRTKKLDAGIHRVILSGPDYKEVEKMVVM